MARIACVVLLLLLCVVGAAPAAAGDPTVKLYTEVRERLQVNPENAAVMGRLRPPSDAKDRAQRAAFDEIVTVLEQAAPKHPKSFQVAYNYYAALWNRYLYYGTDRAPALQQLGTAAKLAEPGSSERMRCEYEQALNILAIRERQAATLPKGPQRDAELRRLGDAAIEQLLAVKKTASADGPHARRAALALADLYIEKNDVAGAKKLLREALELDVERGYVTNRAYGRLGLLLVRAGQLDRAQTMLVAAGRVEPNEALKARGYAPGLAHALILAGKYEKPIQYLEAAYQLAVREKVRANPEIIYALALGYTKMDKAGLALMYWKKYLDLGDPEEARRKEAKGHIAKLIAKSMATGSGGG